VSTIYQLKIELAGSHPKIWRRLTMPSNTPFDHLHDIIQISMGWNDEYPFEFISNETTIRDFGAEVDMGDDPYYRDATETDLDELVTMVKTRFTYIYNFHDHWEHQITLEEILPSGEAPVYPVCTGGEGGCPPDDCGGISRYQEMLNVLADEKHLGHNTLKKQLGDPEDVALFNIEEVNARLRRYLEEWDEIYSETEEDFEDPDDENDDAEFDGVEASEYERLKHLKSPQDLLNDEREKQAMEDWLDDALAEATSVEYNTLSRLVNLGHNEEKSKVMIIEAFSIERFYDLKYGTDHFDDRYEYNLGRLPETPREIPSLDCAVEVLDKCTKGIPFAAIEYLHNDTSCEATAAIVKALKNFSDHQYCWEDCAATPIWYALAAEGHICEELIDPVIGFYGNDNVNVSDWIQEQGQYLIGKLAQKYPDIIVQKVLAAMEEDAEDGGKDAVYFLFDVFDFCTSDKYKDRLIALLKRDDISWHDTLASTIAYLQIKEGLPLLKEQLKRLKSKKPEKGSGDNQHMIEIKEAIEQLEKGENLYPDVDMPLCLKRGAWRQEFANAEVYFYGNEHFAEDNVDMEAPDYFDPNLEFARGLTYQQPIIKENKTGRNDPCPCGSGKKYKKCCLDKDIGVA
jgi:hypothetical protein